MAQDTVLESKVDHDDALPHSRIWVGLGRCYLGDLLTGKHGRMQLVKGVIIWHGDNAPLERFTRRPELMDDCPGINVGDSWDVHLLQVLIQGQTAHVISSHIGEGADNDPLNRWHNCFINIPLNPGTANIRLGKHQQLVIVNLVSNNFLVTGHAGVKNYLAKRDRWSPKVFAGKNRAIFKNQVTCCH